MNEASNGLLERRLDRLEERGRAVLTAAARRAAWRDATTLAARASIVAPVLLVFTAWIRPVPFLPAILFALFVPLGLLGLAFGKQILGFRFARGEALGLVDRSLEMKDRSAITAEFLSSGARDGFRQAALQEAVPWLDRAALAEIGGVARPPVAPRDRWVWPMLAVPLLALALFLPHPVRGDQRAGPGPALAQLVAALGLRLRGDADLDRADAGADRQGQEAGRDGAGGPGARAGASVAAQAGGRGAEQTASAIGDPQMATAASPGAGGGASPPSGAGRADGAGVAARSGGAEAQPTARDGRDGRQDKENSGAKDAEGSAGETRTTTPQGAQSGAAALSSPTGSPPPRAPGGDQEQQGSGARNRQPSGEKSQGSGSSGRANNNGRQGSNRGDGREGTKRAHGSSSLLLAVPMEDRVIGTVNAGAVSSTTRNAPPRAMAAGVVAAQSRGAGQGPDAHLPQRARSVQEDRLLEAYFRRAGVER